MRRADLRCWCGIDEAVLISAVGAGLMRKFVSPFFFFFEISSCVTIMRRPRRLWMRECYRMLNEDIPANEAHTLDDHLGDLVESSDDFVGVHLEHDFQTVQVRGAPLGGSTEGLDWGARHRAPPGGSIGELDWEGLVSGLYVARTRLVYQGV